MPYLSDGNNLFMVGIALDIDSIFNPAHKKEKKNHVFPSLLSSPSSFFDYPSIFFHFVSVCLSSEILF